MDPTARFWSKQKETVAFVFQVHKFKECSNSICGNTVNTSSKGLNVIHFISAARPQYVMCAAFVAGFMLAVHERSEFTHVLV